MTVVVNGIGDWFSNLFGSSSASNAAGLGSTDATFSEQPARPQTQEQINAAYRGGPGYTPEAQTALGMNAKQWGDVGKALGAAGQGMGGQQAATQAQQQQQRGGAQGLHQGSPAAFNSLLTQILQRRAAMPGAASQPPPGLMGASRG